jgi:N-acetylglucosamine kinase-like BadF-type ATPase
VTHQALVLGADGGGTKTMGLLAESTGALLASGRGDGSNQNVIGIENAARNLAGLIETLARTAGRPVAEIGSVVLGLAGAGAERDREVLIGAIQARLHAMGLPTLPISIQTDGRIALEGAFNGGPGVVAVAGTGSVVMGKTPDGETLSIGGWGRVIGDEGSGYFIGLEALRAVSREIDGRGEAGSLRASIPSRFGLETREGIIAAIYREKFDIPSIAPVVLEAAEAGDQVALEILARAAREFSLQVITAVERLGLQGGTGVVMIGGLIDHDTIYARMLAAEIKKASPAVDFRAPMNGPAHGALLLAMAGLKGD